MVTGSQQPSDSRVAVSSNRLLAPLYEAVGEIVCRQYLCCLCAERLAVGMAHAKDGPEAMLKAIAEHQGMLCASAEWMREKAIEALGANDRGEL